MTRLILTTLLLVMNVFPSLSWAQEVGTARPPVPVQSVPATPPKAQRHIYQSSSGEIFLQPSQSLYFEVSGSKGGPRFLLQSKAGLIERFKHQPVRPFQFHDGEGRHTLVHPAGEGHYWSGQKKLDTVGDENIFYFHLDGHPPVTRVHSRGAVRAGTKKGVYYGGPMSLSLKAVDQGAKLKSNYAGVKMVFYSVDGAAFSPYTNPLSFQGERLHQLRFYGVDNVGNQERLHTFNFRIDTTAPHSKVQFRGIRSGRYLAASSRLGFLGSDRDSGLRQVHYKLIGPKRTHGVYHSPISFKKWPDGEYKIRYRAIDRVRNTEPEQSASFYLDTKAPKLRISAQGPGFRSKGVLYVSRLSKIKLQATDVSSGVAWIRVKGAGKTQTYRQPLSVPSKAGSFVLKAWAADKVKNQSRAIQYKLVLDPKAPHTKLKLLGPQFFGSKGQFISSKTRVKLFASDGVSGVKRKKYGVDRNQTRRYRSPFSIAQEGRHTVRYFSVDHVDNQEKANRFHLIVDNTPPSIETKFSVGEMSEGVYPKGSLLFVIGSDRAAGLKEIWISTNGARSTRYEQPPRFNQAGRFKVVLQAIDRVGNHVTTKLSFRIK